MHVECNSCNTRYTIADEKIPPQGARVRCRKCQAVFQVPGPPSPSPLPLIPPTPEPVTAPPQAPSAPAPTPASPRTVSSYAPSAGIPEGLPEAERLKHERARRFARVLASDIAIYNKEKKERGVKDGNLVAVLGYEIKKSWEVYKERVTPELANSTPYFRDALNEMLAEGKKVF